jgi:SWIM zinc finger
MFGTPEDVQRMALSLAKIEALAPDQVALDAARKLLKPASWPTLACDASGLVWGEAQGSGAAPYRVMVSEIDARYKCTCPSRKFPCKHSLALMWLRAEGKLAFASAAPPEWVQDWIARRRGPSQVSAEEGELVAKASLTAALAGEREPGAGDPKVEARAAAQRERNRLDREASVLAGLDELDLWLSDQVERGAAAFVSKAGALCRQIAQRLVDAKASSLAARLDGLPARLFALDEAARPKAAVAELGVFHLIGEAYRRQDLLDRDLREDVRQMMGWSQTREGLLADANALRAAGRWRVFATRVEAQPDKLRRIETWLSREGEGDGPRFALLLDFAPATGGGASSGYIVGETFEAELAFYASAAPLRALIAAQTSPFGAAEASAAPPGASLTEAWQDYERALQARPWLGDWPLPFRGAEVKRTGEALFLTEFAGAGIALPIARDQAVDALPLAGAGPLDGIGIWDGWGMRLCAVDAQAGHWAAA